MIDTPPLEIHVTHNCNLQCQGCNHYTNFRYPKWMMTVEEFEATARLWADKINPSTFNLLGGEPTLNPHLCDILKMACRYFNKGSRDDYGKDCAVALTTNGFFLHKHADLKQILIDN